jgi:hypothetical protein
MRERAAGSLKAKADEMGGSKESGRLSPISRVRFALNREENPPTHARAGTPRENARTTTTRGQQRDGKYIFSRAQLSRTQVSGSERRVSLYKRGVGSKAANEAAMRGVMLLERTMTQYLPAYAYHVLFAYLQC